MNTLNKVGFLLLTLSLTSLGSAGAKAMTLDEFLTKVGVQNNTARVLKNEEKAALLRSSEGNFLTSPNLFLSSNYLVDKKESLNPSLEGTERKTTFGQLGVEQHSILGINHKLFYELSHNELIGVDPTFFPTTKVANSSFNYEFSVPFWRNGWGRNTKDQVAAISEQSKSESFAAQFSQKQLKANAISVYWRLKSSQELYELSKELLETNNNFLKWTQKRVGDRLAENIDLKQAEAAVILRQFELDQAKTELLLAEEAFNEMMEVAIETPTPALENLPDVATWPAEKKLMATLTREDIQSLEALLNAQNAQTRIAAENTKPQIDLLGALSTNGLNSRVNEAFKKSTATNHMVYSVGVKLSIPLDRSSVNDIQRSASLRASGIEAQLARKKFEVQSELEKIESNYKQAMKVYSTAKKVEKIQLEKYHMERERRRTGRTTTFQLFSFQQDYQSAKQALIRAQDALLQLNAQFILFSNEGI